MLQSVFLHDGSTIKPDCRLFIIVQKIEDNVKLSIIRNSYRDLETNLFCRLRMFSSIPEVQSIKNRRQAHLSGNSSDIDRAGTLSDILVCQPLLTAAQFLICYIIPMPPAPPAGIAGVSSLIVDTTDSVVNSVDATLVAFCNALRVTFAGSRIPSFTISTYSSL